MTKIPLIDEYRERELSNILERLGAEVLPDTKHRNITEEIANLYDMNGGYFHVSYGVVSGIITELYKKYEKSYIDQILYNTNSIISFLKDEINRGKNGRFIKAYHGLIALQDFVSMESIRVDQAERQIKAAMNKAESTLSEASSLNEETKRLSLEVQKVGKDAKELDEDAKVSIQKAKELSANVEEKTQELNDKVDRLIKKAEKISEETNNLKTDVISILAIFAAIILAFSGGLSVLGGVFSSIKGTNLSQLLSVTTFCIGGVFNTIYLLLNMAGRMSGKNLSADCKKGECKDCDEKEKCKGINRFRKRAPYVVGFNIFLIIIEIAIIILCATGIIS